MKDSNYIGYIRDFLWKIKYPLCFYNTIKKSVSEFFLVKLFQFAILKRIPEIKPKCYHWTVFRSPKIKVRIYIFIIPVLYPVSHTCINIKSKSTCCYQLVTKDTINIDFSSFHLISLIILIYYGSSSIRKMRTYIESFWCCKITGKEELIHELAAKSAGIDTTYIRRVIFC